MKTKLFLTSTLFMLAMAASAQVQILYLDGGRDEIDRTKKLYWMDGDDDPCFDISNYKKAGNKETFTLTSRELGRDGTKDVYTVTMTLDGNGTPTQWSMYDKKNKYTRNSSVKTSSRSESEDIRLKRYFSKLAGYSEAEIDKMCPNSSASSTGGVSAAQESVPKSPEDLKEAGVKGATDKVKDAAKSAFGKVKGLFKKKK